MTDKLRTAAQMALEALDWFISKEMTVGQRYTNEGQQALDSFIALREALAEQPEREPLTYERIMAAWNAQADERNQWDELGEDEKIEWAVKCAHGIT